MKRTSFFVLFLFLLAGITGYVLSKASLIGRVGISLFYKQYSFLKVWWQAGLAVLAIWMLLFFLQHWAQRKLPAAKAKLVHAGTMVIALAGLFFTYQDFRHTVSHRWLGDRFHWGGYLFWIGWLAICIFYLTQKRETVSTLDRSLTDEESIRQASHNLRNQKSNG